MPSRQGDIARNDEFFFLLGIERMPSELAAC